MRRLREPSRGWSAARRDLLLILAAVLSLVGLGSASGVFDGAYEWIDQRFEGHLGNALALLLLLCVGLSAFATLQWRSARRESETRRGVETRFRAMVERVPAVTYTWDPSKHAGEAPVEYISPQIEALLGYPPEDFQADPKLWSSLVHPDDLQRVRREWETADETDGTVLSEYRMRSRDGRQVWVRDEAVPVSRNDTHPKLQGVMFDITQRRVAEERLQEAQERFRSLVEQIPAITYIQDLDGRFLYTSPQIESVLGFTAEEWMTDPSFWKRQLHPEDHDRVIAEDTNVTEDEWSSTYRMVARDGSVVWLLDHTALLRDGDGAPRYWQGVAFDVTELTTAEDRVTEAEASYRTLVEQLPVVVYRDAIDDLSTALYISPQYEQLFGFPVEARMSDPEFWVEHLHPDDRDRIIELSKWTNDTGEPFSAEYRFLAREGRIVWVRDEAVLLRGPDGTPIMWQGVLLDITARKEAEAALSRRDSVLEAIGYAAERFLKTHDWATAIPEVLERIGRAAGASRVYVYENVTLEDGRLAMSLRSEWLAPNIMSLDIPANHGFAYADGFIRWQAVLSSGTELHGLTRNFPETERAALHAEAVLSQIVVPVFVGDEWWGFLGFDDCVAERIWPPAEVEALKAAADTLGAAIGRTQAERERAAAQSAAAELEARTSAVLASALEGIVTMDGEGLIVDFNPAAERMFGHRRDDIVGRPLADVIIPPEFRDRHRAALDRFMRTGEASILGRNLELEALRASGERFPVELTVTEVRMPHTTLFTGFIRDLTERRQAEQQLRETEARYRSLVENMPAATYIDEVDELSTTLFVSPQIEAIWGYTPAEWIGEPSLWIEAIHPDDRDRIMAAVARHNEMGEPFEVEYRFRAKDGRWTWVGDHATAVRDDQGRIAFSQGVMFDVTERRHAEEQLREAEERYRALVEAAPAVVYRMGVDDSWPLLFVSPSVQDVFGEPPQWWSDPPRSWRGFIHPEDLEEIDRNTRESVESGQAFGMEYRVVRPDGRTMWIFDNAILVNDEHGDPRYWQGIFVDLSAQKELEEAQRESELRYRSVVENVPMITYIEGPGGLGDLRFISPQVEAILGYAPEERYGDLGEWLGLVHPDDLDALMEEEDATQVTVEPFHAEYRVRAKDGRWVWLRDDAMPIRDENGELLFWQGIQQDVTERRQAEEALRQAEERYRAIVEHIPAITYVDGLEREPIASIYISPQVELMLGFSPQEWVSDAELWVRQIHPDDRERVLALSDQADETGEPYRAEYRFLHRDGHVLWLRDESVLIHDQAGRPLFWQGVIYDITQLKLANEALVESERRERESADRLRALDEMKNTFLAAVSHELRSPLTSILGLTLTLERHTLPEDEQTDLLGRLATNARKLDRLLKDLLDVDRLSRGIVTPKVRPTDLSSIVERTVENLDVLAGRSILIEAEPVVLSVDPPKIERIVENLVMNAARHTDPDAGIWVRVWSQDGGAIIAVEDDGPGVPTDLRRAIFEPFRQGPSSVSSPSPGTGIGLSLVAMFAELHGGRAWVEDREGGGASFRVFLPAGPSDGATGNGRGGQDTHAVGSRTSG